MIKIKVKRFIIFIEGGKGAKKDDKKQAKKGGKVEEEVVKEVS